MPTELDLREVGDDVSLFQVVTMSGPVTYGVGSDGHVYLSLDLHPAGVMEAMRRMEEQGVGFIPDGAVNTLVPAQWLVSECMGDSARLGVIDRLLLFIEGRHK